MSSETKTGTILDRIVTGRRANVAYRKRALPEAAVRLGAKKAPPVRDFSAAIGRHSVNVIAELKKASPSRGVIREDFEPAVLARELESAGAAALSVLTEEEFFQGSLKNMRESRKAVTLPVLRKDFIFDPWQVWEARANDADSFLLIVAILSDTVLADLLGLGRELGMEPPVEAHTREELVRAVDAGAKIIGVNNRNLKTLDVRVATSYELIEMIPNECIAVCESGLSTKDDLRELRAAGFDAFLIGEHLMQSPNPDAALRALLGKPERNADSFQA